MSDEPTDDDGISPPDYTVVPNQIPSYTHILKDLYTKWHEEDNILTSKYDQLRHLEHQTKDRRIAKVHHDFSQKIQQLNELERQERTLLLHHRQEKITQITKTANHWLWSWIKK